MLLLLPLFVAASAYFLGLPAIAILVFTAFGESLLAYWLTKKQAFLRMLIGTAIVGIAALLVPNLASTLASSYQDGGVSPLFNGALPQNLLKLLNPLAGISAAVTIVFAIVGAWKEGSSFLSADMPKGPTQSTRPGPVYSYTPAASDRQSYFERNLGAHIKNKDARVKVDFQKDRKGEYRSPATRAAYAKFDAAPEHARNSDDLMTSMLVGYLTDSAAIGYLAGGSLTGAVLGSSLADHHTAARHGDSPNTANSLWNTDDADSKRNDSPSFGLGTSGSDGDSCRASDYTSSDSGSSSSDSGSSDF